MRFDVRTRMLLANHNPRSQAPFGDFGDLRGESLEHRYGEYGWSCPARFRWKGELSFPQLAHGLANIFSRATRKNIILGFAGSSEGGGRNEEDAAKSWVMDFSPNGDAPTHPPKNARARAHPQKHLYTYTRINTRIHTHLLPASSSSSYSYSYSSSSSCSSCLCLWFC